jgi:hypothetical protein
MQRVKLWPVVRHELTERKKNDLPGLAPGQVGSF